MEKETENNFEKEKRIEDLNFLKEKLEEIHPDPYRNINQEKEIFEKSLEKSLTVKEEFFPLAVQESLSLLKDAHTTVSDFAGEILPVEYKKFGNDFYVIGTWEENTKYIGSKLLKINDYGLEKIIPELSKLSSKENEEVLSKDLEESLLSSNKVLRYYDFSTSEGAKITTEKGDFEVKSYHKDRRPKVITKEPLEWKKHYTGNEIYRFRLENNTLLFQYNSCSNKGFREEDLENFKKELLKEIPNIKNIVVDLRLNGGGDSRIMHDLFEKFPEEKNIYVAMSPKTFSSATHHLFYLKRKKGAILIGENAGEKPNRFGDGKKFTLPNSKITIVSSSKEFNLFPEKDLETVEPDIKIPITIEDYINETDPLNKWIEENLKD